MIREMNTPKWMGPGQGDTLEAGCVCIFQGKGMEGFYAADWQAAGVILAVELLDKFEEPKTGGRKTSWEALSSQGHS